MKSWPQVTLRTFGALHMLVAVLGVTGVAWTLLVYAPRWLGPNPAYPYALQFCYVYAAVDLLCLIFLARAGVALWRLESRGRWLSNAVLGFEMFWFLAIGQTSFLLLTERTKALGASMIRARGMGTDVQVLAGYPLIALIAINLAYRRLHQASSASATAALRAETEPRRKSWPRAVLRVFGVVDIAAGLCGLYSAPLWYKVVVTGGSSMDTTHPYMLSIFRTETTVGVLCLLLLIPTGIALWCLKRRGLWMTRALLAFAFLYLLTEQGLRLLLLTRGGAAKDYGSSLGSSIGIPLFILPIILSQFVAVFVVSMAFRAMREPSGGNVPK